MVIVNYWILYYHDGQSMAIDTINRIVYYIDDLSISRRLNSKIILQEAIEKVLDKWFGFGYNEPIKNEVGN